MPKNHVKGKNIGNIIFYALSTCIWCKKTKRLLNNLGIEYFYYDIDLCSESEKAQLLPEIAKWNPDISYPTIVIENKKAIIHYDEKKIKALVK